MTWRELGVLVDHLPPESATVTAIRDGMSPEELADLPQPEGHGPWSRTEQLLADVCDRLDWVIYAVYASEGGKPQQPKPMRRPGVVDRPVVPMSAEVMEHLTAMRNRPGSTPVRAAGPEDRAAAARHMIAMRNRDGG
jgi:hypothetical protein